MTNLKQKSNSHVPMCFPLFIETVIFEEMERNLMYLDFVVETEHVSNDVGLNLSIYEISKANLDIREIIRNRNTKGYIYNSYLLKMIILKLEYALSLMKPVKVIKNVECIDIVKSVLYEFSAYYKRKVEEYQIENDPDSIG